jgi:hypothetical protein
MKSVVSFAEDSADLASATRHFLRPVILIAGGSADPGLTYEPGTN